jgi:dienelactone hydrolase
LPESGRRGQTPVLLDQQRRKDPFIKREQYEVLKKELDSAKADYRVIEYPGAVHAFTNSEATELGQKFNLPLRYDAQVDQQAKAEAVKFLDANLKK